MALAARTKTNPGPGLMKLLGEIAARYGASALHDSPEASDAIGEDAVAFCLYVPWEQHGEASQFCSELCGDIDDEFNEQYFVIILPAD
jgi:hypothetical protein